MVDDHSWIGTAVDNSLVLAILYIGFEKCLFDRIDVQRPISSGEVAGALNLDEEYVARWCLAAFAFGILEGEDEKYMLSPKVAELLKNRSLFSSLIHIGYGFSSTGALFAEFMEKSQRPGFTSLSRNSPLFGDVMRGAYNEGYDREILMNEVLSRIEPYALLGGRNKSLLDLGSGNGWFSVALAERFKELIGVGIDLVDVSIEEARALAAERGVDKRIIFKKGEISKCDFGAGFDLITMNQSFRFFWDSKEEILGRCYGSLKKNGYVAIWEHNLPEEREKLREPGFALSAYGNFINLAAGARLLNGREIEGALRSAGFKVETYYVHQGLEVIVLGNKK